MVPSVIVSAPRAWYRGLLIFRTPTTPLPEGAFGFPSYIILIILKLSFFISRFPGTLVQLDLLILMLIFISS